jgi:hypothetical protein
VQSSTDNHSHLVQEQLLAEIQGRIAELQAQCQSIREIADALASERTGPRAEKTRPEPLHLIVSR